MSNQNQEIGPSTLPRTPPVVFVLTAGIAVIGANSLALSPIAAEVAASFGVAVPAVMAATAAYGLGTAFAAVFLARAIDRIGSRRVLVQALAVLALAFGVSASAPNAAALVAGQVLAGLGAGVALPAIYALAAEVAPPGRESATLGVVLTGWTLSLVAGVSLSAVIADLVHWRLVYAFLVGAALLGLLALLVSPDREAGGSGVPAPSPLQALALPGVVRLLLVCAAYMIAFYGVYGYIGAHLHEGLGLATSANAAVPLAYGIGFGAAALLDRVIDWVGPGRAMPCAYLGIAAVYAALALGSGNYLAIVAIALLWGLLNHFGLNLLILRLTAVDPARRGTILGLNSAVTYLCVFLGTLGFGPLYSHAGFASLAWIAAGLCLVAALLTTGGAMESRRGKNT
ncbi:MAG: MFS transporter [Kiloniellales bacterium]|nr:MFS transporter [Kiloniellales bacterium]